MVRPHDRHFMNLGSEAERELQQRLQQSGGKALVVVHPYYRSDDHYGPEHEVLAADHKSDLNAYIQTTGTPKVLFEQAMSVDATFVTWIQLGIAWKDLIIVSTHNDSPLPNLSDDRNLGPVIWKRTIDQLRSLGVRSVDVVGKLFWKQGLQEKGCVPAARDAFIRYGIPAVILKGLCSEW